MNRIAVIGIIVEEPQEVEKLNQLLEALKQPLFMAYRDHLCFFL